MTQDEKTALSAIQQQAHDRQVKILKRSYDSVEIDDIYDALECVVQLCVFLKNFPSCEGENKTTTKT